ncbi:hypothetical protein CDO09_12320 [Xanthomonas perforans]|nr:hypothetical protein CDO09_12320 [Xanthomonas perforans]
MRLGFGIRDSGIGNRESGIGNRESGIGNRKSGWPVRLYILSSIPSTTARRSRSVLNHSCTAML